MKKIIRCPRKVLVILKDRDSDETCKLLSDDDCSLEEILRFAAVKLPDGKLKQTVLNRANYGGFQNECPLSYFVNNYFLEKRYARTQDPPYNLLVKFEPQ